MHKLRRSDRALDLESSRAFLSRAWVGRLATVGPDGPYVTPLCFVYAPPDTIYFHCAHRGHKLDNIDRDPRVCLEVDKVFEVTSAERACDHSIGYLSVIAFGIARRVTDCREKSKALAMLMDKYAGDSYPAVSEEEKSETTVIAVDIEYLTGKSNLPQGERRELSRGCGDGH